MDVTPFLEVTLKTEDGEVKEGSRELASNFREVQAKECSRQVAANVCDVHVKEEPREAVTEFCVVQVKEEHPDELSENGDYHMEESAGESSEDGSTREEEEECERPLLVLLPHIQEEEVEAEEGPGKKEAPKRSRGVKRVTGRGRGRGSVAASEAAPMDLSKQRRTLPQQSLEEEEEAVAGERKVELGVSTTETRDLPGTRGAGSRRGGGSGTVTPKKHRCPQCNKAFATPSHLRTHQRTHTGTKPFRCSDCTASFSQSNNLRRHVRTHTLERPYKCSECDCAFRDSSHLQRHRLLHTGERPFRCHTCGTAFAQSNTLRDHLRLHTGERPFACVLCPEAFVRRSHLNAHCQRMHGTPVGVAAAMQPLATAPASQADEDDALEPVVKTEPEPEPEPEPEQEPETILS